MGKMLFCSAVDKLSDRIYGLMQKCNNMNKKPILESEFGKGIGFGVDGGNYLYYYGIVIIDNPLDGSDVLLVCGIYGGGDVETASIGWWMNREEIRSALELSLLHIIDPKISKYDWVEIE